MSYHPLTHAQRYQIYALKKTSHSGREIAEVLGVHKSTVSRELRRNHVRLMALRIVYDFADLTIDDGRRQHETVLRRRAVRS